MSRLARLAFLVVPLLLACDDQPPKPPAPSASELATLPVDSLEARLAEHDERLDLDGVEKARLDAELDALLANPTFQKQAETLGVRGTGWFRMGEGGAVIKYAKGRGELDLEGGRSDLGFGLEAWSVGGLIGGSASRGFVIVLGLERESALPGDYRGEVTGATAVTENTNGASQLKHKQHGHIVYVVDVAKGMSANAGVSRVKVSLR